MSAKGIDERYGVPYVSLNVSVGVTGTASPGNCYITDKSARTVGKSDVNMYALYHYTWNIGAGTSTGTDKVSTSIKYLKKDTAKKKIQVQHKWSFKNL